MEKTDYNKCNAKKIEKDFVHVLTTSPEFLNASAMAKIPVPMFPFSMCIMAAPLLQQKCGLSVIIIISVIFYLSFGSPFYCLLNN